VPAVENLMVDLEQPVCIFDIVVFAELCDVCVWRFDEDVEVEK